MMEVITDVCTPALPLSARVLTIGNFDGMHLGHLSLLEQARSLIPEEGSLLVYTFINHPTHVLSHLPPIPFIYTLEHKLKLLEENKVDCTILSTFTKELAQTPFDQFLKSLKTTLQFTHLVLGVGASFGKDKQGNEANVRKCAEQLDFEVAYISKMYSNHGTLSSGHIRILIAQGAFSQAEQLLGRPYSIYAPLLFEHTHYMQLYQHCLPPSGTYPVRLAVGEKTYLGKAHIERPTQFIRIELDDAPPVLEAAFGELFF
jgi:riboflavin kinase/FMN adenylyltransferase